MQQPSDASQIPSSMAQNGSIINPDILNFPNSLSSGNAGIGLVQPQSYATSVPQYVQSHHQTKQSQTKTHHHHHHSRSSDKKAQQMFSQASQYVQIQPVHVSLPHTNLPHPILGQNVLLINTYCV